MNAARTFVIVSFLVSALVMGGGGEPSPALTVTVKREDDRVEVKAVEDAVIVALRSPFGISQAVIERTGEKWPAMVVVRLHLKGLEHFRVTNGKVKLEGSASVREGRTAVRLWKDGREDRPLDATSAEWIEVRIVGGDGKPAADVPVKDGYFELRLPKALFEGDPKAITVGWIDFYRN